MNLRKLVDSKTIPSDMKGIEFSTDSDFSKRISENADFQQTVKDAIDKNGGNLPEKIELDFNKDKNLNYSIGHGTLLKAQTTDIIDTKAFINEVIDRMAKTTNNNFSKVSADGIRPQNRYSAERVIPKQPNNQMQTNDNNGISFMGEKQSEPMSFGKHADFINDLTTQNVKTSLAKKIGSVIKDFGKGAIQNVGSILEGIERRSADNNRNQGNDVPTDYDIRNKYGKIYGLPSDSKAFDFGKLISEIVLLMSIPVVTLESFPLTIAFLINAAIQILGSRAMDYARYKDDKKFTDDLLSYSLDYFVNILATHGLLKGIDKNKILEIIKPKLNTLWEKIKIKIARPICLETLQWRYCNPGRNSRKNQKQPKKTAERSQKRTRTY